MLFGLVLGGCASQPVAVAPEPAPTTPEPVITKIDDKPFDSETLYALLVAEFAGDRKRYDVMLSNYVQQAQATQDPEVTARATHIARFVKDHDAALAMSAQWVELDPTNIDARYNAAIALTEANQVMAAMDHAEYLLRHNEPSGVDAISVKAARINDPGLNSAMLERLDQLKSEYPNEAPIYISLSLIQQYSGDLDNALANAVRARNLAPDDFQANAQELRVLQKMGDDGRTLEKLDAMVELYPTNPHLRLEYARNLVKTDVEEAENQFLTLLKNNPSDIDIRLYVALIQFELEKYNQAQEHFLLLTQHERHKSTGHAYLGRIAVIENNANSAIRHFRQVSPGKDYLSILSLLTDVYVEQGLASTALEYLNVQIQLPQLDEDQKEGIVLLQSQVMNKTGEVDTAISHLSDALVTSPKSPRLRYARAMLFSQQDDIANAEQDFKQVLEVSPDNAAVLNALGYTLADRTQRIDEAFEYIQRAYQITPDDPAIIDSMGWVEYLRGNHQRALKLLKQAMQAMPDHEIAAHLGEVLWVTGDQALAREIWQQGLNLKPDSSVIHNTIQRLEAGLSHQP